MDKIQHIFMTKTLNHTQQWKAEIIFSKKSNKTRGPLLPHLFKIVSEVLATAIRQKEIKGIHTEKK